MVVLKYVKYYVKRLQYCNVVLFDNIIQLIYNGLGEGYNGLGEGYNGEIVIK